MTDKNDGGPAFPSVWQEQSMHVPAYFGPVHPTAPQTYTVVRPGMSLRDWFAGQVASGMSGTYGMAGTYGPAHFVYEPNEIAKRAYQVADAMLKARAGE